MRNGDIVNHPKYGHGKIVGRVRNPTGPMYIRVEFDKGPVRDFLPSRLKETIIDNENRIDKAYGIVKVVEDMSLRVVTKSEYWSDEFTTFRELGFVLYQTDYHLPLQKMIKRLSKKMPTYMVINE